MGGWLSDRIGSIRVQLISLLFSGIGFAFFTVLVWPIGEMPVFPMMAGFIASRANASSRGKYMGMLSFNISLAFVIGPMIGSAIYTKFGGDVLWIIVGITGVVVWPNLFMLGLKQPQSGVNSA